MDAEMPGETLHIPEADQIRADPDGRRAWIGYRSGLALIEPGKRDALASVDLDGHPESLEIEAKGKRIFVNVPKAGQIAVVDRENQQIVDRWKLADAKDNGPMALDETGRRLFVVCRRPAKVLAYDIDTGKVVAWTDCVADAGGAVFDQARKRLYVTGDGSISVLQLDARDRLKLIGKVPTAPGARTSAWIPSSSRLCVGVSLKGKGSEVWVYRAMP